MKDENGDWCYAGKFFATEAAFQDYVKEFENEKVTQESYTHLINFLVKDVWINYQMRSKDSTIKELKNSELRRLIEKWFLGSLEDFSKPTLD